MTHPSPVDFDEVTRIQERAIAEAIQILEDHNEVLIEAPTGAGKTRINARILEEIAKRAGPDFNSLNLCHRERLATQSQDAFRQWVPESPLTTCIARDGNFDQSADNVYALVQTAAARVDEIKKYDVGRSEEHTSELQSLLRISSAVFC